MMLAVYALKLSVIVILPRYVNLDVVLVMTV